MEIIVFTYSAEIPKLEQLLAAVSGRLAIPIHGKFYHTYDDFIAEFPRDTGQAVLVARRGAEGMESARNAKLIHPAMPLVWFSDDPGFGVESYRIGCVFFSAEAMTEDLLSTALTYCEAKGGN